MAAGAPERVCFTLQIRSGMLQDYLAAHEVVWPEMLEALREAGWRNYSLFVDQRSGLVVGYVEPDDLAAAQAVMSRSDVNARWQASMSRYFELAESGLPDEGFVRLSEYFHLD
jgi:L-rhamnose mutarotase